MIFTRLMLLFILVPIIELALFLTLGERIGIPWTLALIVVTAVLGASLTRWQGFTTMARFQQRLRDGQIPGEELIGGIFILVAGALLLTPGFLTDVIGFSLLVPAFRKVLAKFMMKRYANKIEVNVGGVIRAGTIPKAGEVDGRPSSGVEAPVQGRVIDVETVDPSENS